MTGPNLRASGVDLDLRKDKPYLGYENYDFEVPIGLNGDSGIRISYESKSTALMLSSARNMPSMPIGIWLRLSMKRQIRVHDLDF